MPTAVLYTPEEARRFRAERPPASAVLALSPDARAALRGLDIPVRATTAVYGDSGHARVAALVRRADREIGRALARETALGVAARLTLRHEVQMVAAAAARLWVMLGRSGPGPWLVPEPSGWAVAEERAEAQARLLARIAGLPESFPDPLRQSPFAAPLRWLNRLAARALRSRRVALFTAFQSGMGPLAAGAGALRPPVRAVALRGFRGHANEHLRPFVALWRLARGARATQTLVVPATPSAAASAAARRALGALTGPAVRRGVAAFEDSLLAQTALTEGLVSEMGALIALLRPRALVAHALRWADDAALGEAAAAAGLPSVLISHGSHPPPAGGRGGVVARAVLAPHAEGLLVSPLADAALVQSPHAEAAARAFDPAMPRRRIRPALWAWRGLPEPPVRSPIRTVLHAGTFKRLARARPWMYETADEFVEGLTALVVALESVSAARLVVRLRPASECAPETLRALLPESGRVEVRLGGSFLDDLAAADLLVSFSSTTLEEALHARRPVVLWGGSMRYRHLAARTRPPEPGDRAAVYAPARAEDLGPLIAAVLAAHAGRPLTDAELAAHVWPAGAPDAVAVLDEIAVPLPRRGLGIEPRELAP
ncbi:MAG: hypothetical protein HY521_10195 [Proteobacteria bacterium]|nr:hypothetical protein [Pseudomonadota bacterium]